MDYFGTECCLSVTECDPAINVFMKSHSSSKFNPVKALNTTYCVLILFCGVHYIVKGMGVFNMWV